jgi:hypothetical protein
VAILNSSLAKLASTFNVGNKGDFNVLQLVEGYDRAFNLSTIGYFQLFMGHRSLRKVGGFRKD